MYTFFLKCKPYAIFFFFSPPVASSKGGNFFCQYLAFSKKSVNLLHQKTERRLAEKSISRCKSVRKPFDKKGLPDVRPLKIPTKKDKQTIISTNCITTCIARQNWKPKPTWSS